MFYAIGEIILVVIGILIALSINNWNQERIELRKEILTLNGLKVDLIDLAERLELWEDFNRTGERLVIGVLNFDVNGIDKPVMDSLFSSLVFVNVLDKGGGPLEAIISTGRLELIRDQEIREKLSRWPDKLEDLHTNDITLRDLVWHEIIPYMAEFGIPEFNCGQEHIYCIRDEPISENYLKILNDNKFKALMRIRLIAFERFALDYKSKGDEAKEILKLIEDYLIKESGKTNS